VLVWPLIRLAFFKSPLVAISNPASIPPFTVAFKSNKPVFWSSVEENSSSSNLLPAVLTPKATIPQGPSLAATKDGIDSTIPSTVLSAAEDMFPFIISWVILPSDLSIYCSKYWDVWSKNIEGLNNLFLICIAFFSERVSSSPKSSLLKTSMLVLKALA